MGCGATKEFFNVEGQNAAPEQAGAGFQPLKGTMAVSSPIPTRQFSSSASDQGQKVKWNAKSERELVIIHFNDVYNIEQRTQEPVGGAARFVYKVKSLAPDNPLVLFSGDAFSPSIMSTVTQGKQMVPVLRAMNVNTCCVGNHDLDFGVPAMNALIKETDMPWLASNVIDKSTGQPLGGFAPYRIIEWAGVKIGIMGLVESEWLVTLATLSPEQIDYTDFVDCGRDIAKKLRAAGCEMVIALTHMRVPNDTRLAQEAPEIDLILGGHDHHYEIIESQPHGTFVCKSGTDFRDLTVLSIAVPPNGGRPRVVNHEHIQITSEIPEDPEIARVTEHYSSLVGAEMSKPVGWTLTDIVASFPIIRTQEANVGNLLCDIWREATGVDVVILNSGTIRSDQIHPAGELKVADLVAMLPMIDETCVLEMPGGDILLALENGVSQYPRLEGRFPQVSGIRFKFDPKLPAGNRILEPSVTIGGRPLDHNKKYKVATKDYLRLGKDGFDVFARQRCLQGGNESPIIPYMVRNHVDKLANLNTVLRTKGHTPEHLAAEKAAIDARGKDDGKHSYTAIYDQGLDKYCVCPRIDGRIICVGSE